MSNIDTQLDDLLRNDKKYKADLEKYRNQIEDLINEATNKAIIGEYQDWLDQIEVNKRLMKEAAARGELTTMSFGSASGAMETAGFIQHMKNRIEDLTKRGKE